MLELFAYLIVTVVLYLWLSVTIEEFFAARKRKNPVTLAHEHLKREASILGMDDKWIEEHMPAMVEHFSRMK